MKIDLDTLLGIAVIASTLLMMIIIVMDHKDKGDMIDALIVGLKEANSNARALDLAENLATKVVPADFPDKVNKAADFVEAITPDQIDKLVEQLRRYFVQITDGLPNDENEGEKQASVESGEAPHEGVKG